MDQNSTYSDVGEMLPVAKNCENCKSEGVSNEIQDPKSNTEEVMDQSITYSDNCEVLPLPNNSENCKSERVSDKIQHQISNTESENIDTSSNYLCAKDSSTLIHPVTFQELASLDLSMSPGWMKEMMTCNKQIIVRFSLGKCNKINYYFESIVLSDMTFIIRILGSLLGATETNIDLSPIYTIQRLQDLLFTLNSLNICKGVRVVSVFDQVHFLFDLGLNFNSKTLRRS